MTKRQGEDSTPEIHLNQAFVRSRDGPAEVGDMHAELRRHLPERAVVVMAGPGQNYKFGTSQNMCARSSDYYNP
jgi:hypothetical protein